MSDDMKAREYKLRSLIWHLACEANRLQGMYDMARQECDENDAGYYDGQIVSTKLACSDLLYILNVTEA